MELLLQLATLVAGTLGGNLAVRLVRHKMWRERPIFVALVLLLTVTTGAEFAFYFDQSLVTQYAAVYWKLTTLEIAVSIACLCECLECETVALLVVVTFGTLGWVLPLSILWLTKVAACLVVAGIWISYGSKERAVPLGLAALYLPWIALLYFAQLPRWTACLPLYALLVALSIWWYAPVPDSNS